MDTITALATMPIPTAVLGVSAFLLLLGYRFFVIPMIDEVTMLRKKNVELQKKVDDKIEGSASAVASHMEQLLVRFEELHAFYQRESSVLKSDHEKLSAIVSGLAQSHIELDKLSDSIKDDVTDVRHDISRMVDMFQSFLSASRSRDESLDRILRDLERSMTSIEGTNNQILGALLGMSRLHDKSRGI